jgi:hypothetical protein
MKPASAGNALAAGKSEEANMEDPTRSETPVEVEKQDVMPRHRVDAGSKTIWIAAVVLVVAIVVIVLLVR